MIKDVNLVKDNQQWRLRLVQNTQCVHHVGHESVGILASDSVSDVEIYCGECAAERLSDDLATC